MESVPFFVNSGMTTIWLMLFAALLMAEVATAGTLVSIWFCAGALTAAALSYTGFGLRSQFIVFVISSSAMMFLLRPAAVKYFNKGFQPTNADRIIGQRAFITEEISGQGGVGAVKADGKIWTAININDGECLPVGTEVTIEEIKGIRVFVKKNQKGCINQHDTNGNNTLYHNSSRYTDTYSAAGTR